MNAVHLHLFALAVMLLGLLAYLIVPDNKPKGVEIGRLMFFIGLLVLLLASGSPSWTLLR